MERVRTRVSERIGFEFEILPTWQKFRTRNIGMPIKRLSSSKIYLSLFHSCRFTFDVNSSARLENKRQLTLPSRKEFFLQSLHSLRAKFKLSRFSRNVTSTTNACATNSKKKRLSKNPPLPKQTHSIRSDSPPNSSESILADSPAESSSLGSGTSGDPLSRPPAAFAR